MADKSAIEWTDATWNPIVGCSIVSPGCTNCYAMRMAARIEAMARGGQRSERGSNKTSGAKHYAGTTQASKAGAVWTGKLALAPERILLEPLTWRRPRRIFVNSMGDLFHEDVPDEWIDRVFAVMALAPQHTFQVLTKRATRMRRYLSDPTTGPRIWRKAMEIGRSIPSLAGMLHSLWNAEKATERNWPLRNVWLGVSAERQQEADERIPELLATPAAIRFVSAEPLLGPIDFSAFGMAVHHHPNNDRSSPAVGEIVRKAREHLARQAGVGTLDWIIVGGESGPGARPMHPAWPRAIRDQCAGAGVPFFFKQWGAWGPDDGPPTAGRDRVFEGSVQCAVLSGEKWTFHENGFEPDCDAGGGEWVYRLGKKAAGRLLDGIEHNGMPDLREVPAL